MNILVFNLKQDAEDGILGFTTDWVNALAKRCDRVVVLTLHMGALRVDPNVTVYSIGTEHGFGRPRRLFNFYALLWKVLRERQIDVCFAHMNQLFALLGAPVLKAYRVPTLLWYAHKSVTRSLKLAERLVEAAVTSSASGFQLPSRKLTVIGQGVDTVRFAPAAKQRHDGTLKLLSFGRISPVKRLDIILDAAARLRETHPDLTFSCLFVGDPPNRDGQAYLLRLEEQVRTLKLEQHVRFIPGVPFYRAQDLFQQADIFLNPGDTDSIDKTGLEAMSCGLPIVTSNIAFKEVLPTDMQGISIVPKDDPAAFAETIATIAGWTPEVRRAFGLRGRDTVIADHSIDSLADKLMASMRLLTAKKNNRDASNAG